MPYARLRKGTRFPRKLNPSASAAYGTSGPHFACSTSRAAKHELLTSSSRTRQILGGTGICVKEGGVRRRNIKRPEPCFKSNSFKGEHTHASEYACMFLEWFGLV